MRFPVDGTAGPGPNRCRVFCSESVTSSPLRASISCGIGSGDAVEGARMRPPRQSAGRQPAAPNPTA